MVEAQQILAGADAAERLPTMGGMARPNGVVIVSERYWAFAGVDGSLREGVMASRRPVLRKIPLVRGLAKLAASLSPVFRRRGVTRPRERALLAVALVAPFLLFLLPEAARVPAGLALTAGLVLWLLRGRTLRLHGAEHRAIAAAETRQLTNTWQGKARPSRFSTRCGTNFAALVLPVTFVAERAWPLAPALYTPLLVTLLSLAHLMLSRQVSEGVARAGHPVKASHSAVFGQMSAEGSRLTDLARGANMTPQAMGELVDELEGLGYVARTPDPTDRRAKLITLTASGQECVAAGMDTIADIERRITDAEPRTYDHGCVRRPCRALISQITALLKRCGLSSSRKAEARNRADGRSPDPSLRTDFQRCSVKIQASAGRYLVATFAPGDRRNHQSV